MLSAARLVYAVKLSLAKLYPQMRVADDALGF